ncbi:MAG: response regulator [Campylobacterota bacterium]|nr:response regulator [Campylobacterota bacterium]
MLNVENIIKYTNSLKLMYVEDNSEAREATLLILEDFFENIEVCIDGLDGLDRFKNSDVDLIITDINMPKMNGLEMIKEIRSLNKEIPILVLSAYNESGFFMDSIKLGVEGYLLKPVEIDQFVNMLDKITNKLKLKDELANNLHFLNQYQEAADSSSIVSKSDLDGNITYVNDSFCDITGYTRSELIGKNHNIIRHPDSDKEIFKNMWKTTKEQKKTWSGVIRNRKKDGSSYYVKATIKPMLNKDGDVIEYMGLQNDITTIMSPKKQLSDYVTSLDESIVVIVKIDGFEDIEKTYGPKISQTVEDKFSSILSKSMLNRCAFDKIYVLGDGEYAFSKPKTDCSEDEDLTIENLKSIQVEVSDMELNLGEIDYDISVIMSFACGEDSLTNARYGLKNILKNNQDFIVANDLVQKEHGEAEKNLNILKMVKKALDEYKIVSYFQPIIDNTTQKVVKYESLVRLIDENEKVISPFFFLDTAKKGKYYYQITAMVLENSFNALSLTEMDVTINISVLDIEKKITREKIFDLLNQHKAKLHRVVCFLFVEYN